MAVAPWSIVAYICLTSAAICYSTAASSSPPPRVRVESGELSGGVEHTLISGRPLYAFLGVPYASPPVYKNRFKEPQPVTPWMGVWNATIAGSGCIGLDYITFSVVGREDCLYLNVYTPKLPQEGLISGGLMNVVVYIHGGAFQYGSSIGYGPHYLLDSEDIVYVSINYRLGPLGFASTGDDLLPGNNGLKDQVAALKWVQRNIAAFGGNHDSVTIAGMSAGGASVHYHALSPMSEGLFHRGIAESGSAFCAWALAENTIQKTKELAESLGCPTYYSKDTVKCLRSRPELAIADSLKNFLPWRYNPFAPFGPTVETGGTEQFLTDLPENLPIQNVPLLFSFTKDEGLFPGAQFISDEEILVDMESNWNEILPFILDYNYTISDESLRSEIAQKIKTFYFGNNKVSVNTKNEVVKMLTDRLYQEPVARAARYSASINTSPIYFYEFGYRGKYSLSDKYSTSGSSQGMGVSHGDDTMYVVKTRYGNPHDNVEDAKLIPVMVNMWSSFVKTGVPDVGSSVVWSPVSKNPSDPLKLIKITQNQTFEQQEYSNPGNHNFWSTLPLTEFSGRSESCFSKAIASGLWGVVVGHNLIKP
ncbi:esterase E4 isoform X1 [Acyrthosiphon pisum]|uniref:Carboxylic ester hydrolase n=1 Tax=Acyrthosiphon pisum TaxID=7029 RepID=A0A8R1W6X8_ACYPI|nr:esterase E4 isoform X1 [Acyrthosiphon pisum]|eukprot:XP_003247261.1 PREDICTED: esterase E4 [Acyrthosiphon pisum]